MLAFTRQRSQSWRVRCLRPAVDGRRLNPAREGISSPRRLGSDDLVRACAVSRGAGENVGVGSPSGGEA
jgi:hypothetical protein